MAFFLMFANRQRSLCRGVQVEIDHGNLGPGPGESLRDFACQYTSAANHDGHFALE
jgi:hypothetical protein